MEKEEFYIVVPDDKKDKENRKEGPFNRVFHGIRKTKEPENKPNDLLDLNKLNNYKSYSLKNFIELNTLTENKIFKLYDKNKDYDYWTIKKLNLNYYDKKINIIISKFKENVNKKFSNELDNIPNILKEIDDYFNKENKEYFELLKILVCLYNSVNENEKFEDLISENEKFEDLISDFDNFSDKINKYSYILYDEQNNVFSSLNDLKELFYKYFCIIYKDKENYYIINNYNDIVRYEFIKNIIEFRKDIII